MRQLKKNKKKQTSALLIPAALTSFFAGITEPIDFTYLFAAPVLWIIYSLLSATMNTIMFSFGVVGNFIFGSIDMAAENWIPLWANHWQTFLVQFTIGIIFAILTFFIFKFMIVKFDYATPGREKDDEDVHLLNKKEYQAKKESAAGATTTAQLSKKEKETDPYVERATAFLDLLGGSSNIKELSSCATRLRVIVADPNKMGSDAQFKAAKAVNVVHHGKAIQVIVGLDVAQVLEAMQELRKQDNKQD